MAGWPSHGEDIICCILKSWQNFPFCNCPVRSRGDLKPGTGPSLGMRRATPTVVFPVVEGGRPTGIFYNRAEIQIALDRSAASFRRRLHAYP